MITYLFGAGASYQALPLANEIPEDMRALIQELKSITLPDGPHGNNSEWLKNEFIRRAESLLQELEENKFESIDEYAAWKGEHINYIRAILSGYIALRQIKIRPNSRFQSFDPRYRKFLQQIIPTGVYSKKVRLNLLTWNYDTQIEKAVKNIFEYDWAQRIHEKLNYYPLVDNFGASIEQYSIGNLNTFSLNGACGFHEIRASKKIVTIKDPIIDLNPDPNYNRISQVLYFYYQYHIQDLLQPQLHFGWDKNPYNEKLFGLVIESVKGTTQLISIGYTFPDSNRARDLSILKSMEKLEKIFVQGPTNDEFYKIEFMLKESLPGVKIIHYNTKDKFYIPEELFI